MEIAIFVGRVLGSALDPFLSGGSIVSALITRERRKAIVFGICWFIFIQIVGYYLSLQERDVPFRGFFPQLVAAGLVFSITRALRERLRSTE
jgi:hypothetical protein